MILEKFTRVQHFFALNTDQSALRHARMVRRLHEVSAAGARSHSGCQPFFIFIQGWI